MARALESREHQRGKETPDVQTVGGGIETYIDFLLAGVQKFFECRAIGDIGGYRGCPREAELRAIAAARGITLPRRETSLQGEPI